MKIKFNAVFLLPPVRRINITAACVMPPSPVPSVLQHVQVLQCGCDVLRADASDLAEAADGELSVSNLM